MVHNCGKSKYLLSHSYARNCGSHSTHAPEALFGARRKVLVIQKKIIRKRKLLNVHEEKVQLILRVDFGPCFVNISWLISVNWALT